MAAIARCISHTNGCSIQFLITVSADSQPLCAEDAGDLRLLRLASSGNRGLREGLGVGLSEPPIEKPTPAVAAVVQRVKTRLGALVQGDEVIVASLRRLSPVRSRSMPRPWKVCFGKRRDLYFSRWRQRWSGECSGIGAWLSRTAGNGCDLFEPYHPLPDFVHATFSATLAFRKSGFLVPPATVNHDWRTDAMPVLQAVQQLAPGRVNAAVSRSSEAVSRTGCRSTHLCRFRVAGISDYADDHQFVGEFTGRFNDCADAEPLLVFRPWTVRLAKVTRTEALPSSNARLNWRTDIVANGDPLSVPVTPRSPWRPFVARPSISTCTAFGRAPAFGAFAPSSSAIVRTLQDEFAVEIHFRSDDDRPAAIGFELEVDGLSLDLTLPPGDRLGAELLTPSCWQIASWLICGSASAPTKRCRRA